MSVNPTRRAVLGGAAALPALSVPAFAAQKSDRIVIAIKEYDELEAEWHALNAKFDNAESLRRPIALVTWRGYMIGGSEIDQRRESLLREGNLKASTVEREYRKAKAEYEQRIQAGEDWDKRHGLHEMRQRQDGLRQLLSDKEQEIARMLPETVSGAAAAVEFAARNLGHSEVEDWEIETFKNAVVALRNIIA